MIIYLKLIGIIGIPVALVVIGFNLLSNNKQTPPKEKSKSSTKVESEPGEMSKSGFTGKVLAGSTTLLLDFKKADYNRAVSENKIVLLYFYANWCPICKEEFPKVISAFNELDKPLVIGFRVNFNDNETDTDEKKLAEELGVGYQHTKVFLKNGQSVLRAIESWDKEKYLKEITKI